MNDFKKNNRFGGGGDRRGGDFGKRDFGGRPSFGGGDRGGRGGFGGGFNRGPVELFQATCASCGKSCEVPFKPNGKKPVYCKECFATNGGQAAAPAGERFAARREFAPAPYKSEYKPEAKPQNDAAIGELKRQMDALNTKIDKLLALTGDKPVVAKPIASLVVPAAAVAAVNAKDAAKDVVATEKKPAKKPGKKPSKR